MKESMHFHYTPIILLDVDWCPPPHTHTHTHTHTHFLHALVRCLRVHGVSCWLVAPLSHFLHTGPFQCWKADLGAVSGSSALIVAQGDAATETSGTMGYCQRSTPVHQPECARAPFRSMLTMAMKVDGHLVSFGQHAKPPPPS